MAKKEFEYVHVCNHVTNKTLAKTVDFMIYGDYGANFIAEYRQLINRINDLRSRLKGYKFDKNNDAKSTAVAMLYMRQLSSMKDYLETMKLRAEIEGIDLKNPKVIHIDE